MTVFAILVASLFSSDVFGQQKTRIFSGEVVTSQFELVPKVVIEVETSRGVLTAQSSAEGSFSVNVPDEPLTVRFSGNNIKPFTAFYAAGENLRNIQIRVAFVVPPVSEKVIIEDNALSPEIQYLNKSVFENTLFGRDDQLIQTLSAGINAGQHEGGGKSLEIRRFGFNTDHGGVNGGVKILVDNIQQNQGTQGHGQGYLGNLKSITPELVETVSIINGPFSAAYGDFSGLGVVKINLKESLPNKLTMRFQAGSFNTYRAFAAFSPEIKEVDSFFAYELSRTDGPFINPLAYRRDNVTGNFTRRIDESRTVGFKLNFGRNDFTSSGQIPLDLVSAGALDRFGFIDPENGGKVRLGSVGAYYRKVWTSGATLKADAFIGRSLFDLYSNFTFFLADPIFGDEIQQHDSRLQEGANLQVLLPYSLSENRGLLTFGANLLSNQINVGLYPSISRDPIRKFLPENINNPDVLYTSANAGINNFAGYLQNGIDFFNGHLRLEAGLRFDVFTFKVKGFELGGPTSESRIMGSDLSCGQFTASSCLSLSGNESAAKFQPKLALAWSPFERTPVSFYANYGRGISSQDARGVIRNPDAPKISTTDFYQAGTSYNSRRVSAVFSTFLIDRSSEQVYIPDDGSIEFAGPSRSYGIEFRKSVRFNRYLTLNGGLTQVFNSYFKGQRTDDGSRLIVDSAPKTVANGSIVFSEVYAINSSLNWRHISGYRLDGADRTIRASGHDVVDFSISKRLKKWIDLSFSVDNLLDKKYYETQNYFESRTCPTCGTVERIHATPGFPRTFNLGLTFRLFAKER